MSTADNSYRESKPSALLSVEASSQEVRELRCWPAATHTIADQRILEAARRWASRWDLASSFATLAPRTRPLIEDTADFDARSVSSGQEWNALPSAPESVSIWWSVSLNDVTVSPRRALLKAMFDDEATDCNTGRMADDLADQAWLDWCKEIASLAPPSNAVFLPGHPNIKSPVEKPDGPKALPPFDGSARVRFSWLGFEHALIIGGDIVASWISGYQAVPVPSRNQRLGTPTVPLLQVLTDRPVPLRVDLDSVDIELGALITLRPGDIFCTGHALDKPLSVRVAPPASVQSEPVLFSGYLGALDSWRAIELQQSNPNF